MHCANSISSHGVERWRFPRRVLGLGCLLATSGLSSPGAPASGADDFFFPTTGVRVNGSAVLLAIDDQSLPLRENLVEHLTRPTIRREPVLSPNKDDPLAPDQVAAHFYGSVLHDEGRYRMWYYPVGLREPGDARRADLKNLTQGPVCYAESADGITWTKPILNQTEFRGSRHNNAIALPGELIEGVHVIKDPSDPDPARRYKMVYNVHDGKTFVIRTATSAEGLHWRAADGFATTQYLETASFYRHNGLLVVHGQRVTFSEGGHRAGRQGRAIVGLHFDRWLPGEVSAFLLPEPERPEARGSTQAYAQVHLGVGAMSLGNVCVGLYGLWHNVPGDEDSQKQWGWFGWGKISCDLGLVISNDGLHFREPVKGHAFISHRDAPSTPAPGHDFPTILTQSGNGILNVGDETRIYFGRWLNAAYGQGYHGEVGLAVFPRDRWGSLALYPRGVRGGGIPTRGFAWSAPVRLPARGARVALNADHARQFSIEISNENFELLPAFSGTAAGRAAVAGGLSCAIVWPRGALAELGGRTVRFKINLERGEARDPRLFALYLRTS